MKKLLTKSILAIAVTSVITACSTVQLYPQTNKAEVVDREILNNSNKYSALEIVIADKATKQVQVLNYPLHQNKLEATQYNGAVGNKNVKLNVKLTENECKYNCVGEKMYIYTSLEVSDIIQTTSVSQSNIEVVEIPGIETDEIVNKTDKPADTSKPSAQALEKLDSIGEKKSTNTVSIKDSLGDGEEIIEAPFAPAPVVSPVVAVVTPAVPSQPIAEFTPPKQVKPFLYRGESEEFNNLFTKQTFVVQQDIGFNNGNYTEVISPDAESAKNFVADTKIPVTVKVRLVPIAPLDTTPNK